MANKRRKVQETEVVGQSDFHRRISDHVWTIEELCSLLPETASATKRIDRGLILKALGDRQGHEGIRHRLVCGSQPVLGLLRLALDL